MRFPLRVHLRDPYHCPKFRIVHPSCCRSRLSPLPSPRLLPRSLPMLYFTCFFARPLSLFLDDILLFESFRMICRMSRPLQWMWKNSCFDGWGYLRTGLHISRERILHFVLLAACSPRSSPPSPIVSRRSERPLPDEAPVSVPLPPVVPVCLVELLLG